MTACDSGKIFLLLRKFGFLLSYATRTKIPKTVLRRIFRYAQAKVTVSDFDGDLSMNLHLSDHMQRRIFWMGYYNANIACLLNTLLKQGMTVLDVGANTGEITLLAAKRVGLQGKVFAFEPIDEIARELSRHVQMNHLNQVSIESYALGDVVNNDMPIYASCGQNVEDAHNGLGSLYGGEEDVPLQRIHMTTLDAWLQAHPVIQHIDLIKIDIEGAELPCLRGGRECLQRFKPNIIIEIQDFTATRAGYKSADILDFLSGFGYAFNTIGSNGFLTPLISASLSDFQNVLCTPLDAGTRHP
jgi:FkbM family methyltransferase